MLDSEEASRIRFLRGRSMNGQLPCLYRRPVYMSFQYAMVILAATTIAGCSRNTQTSAATTTQHPVVIQAPPSASAAPLDDDNPLRRVVMVKPIELAYYDPRHEMADVRYLVFNRSPRPITAFSGALQLTSSNGRSDNVIITYRPYQMPGASPLTVPSGA